MIITPPLEWFQVLWEHRITQPLTRNELGSSPPREGPLYEETGKSYRENNIGDRRSMTEETDGG